MSIFGSRKKTYVFTTIQPLFEDESEDVLTNAVVKGIISETGIVNSIKDSIIFGNAYGDIYNYARSGDYYYGLPTDNLFNFAVQSTEGMKTLIETEVEGTEIEVGFIKLGPMDPFFKMYKYLRDTYQYNHVMNTLPSLSDAKGGTVYVENMFVVYDTSGDWYPTVSDPDVNPVGYQIPERKMMRYSETLPQSRYTPWYREMDAAGIPRPDFPAFVFADSGGDEVIATIAWEVGGIKYTEEISLPLTLEELNEEYLMAKYFVRIGLVTYLKYFQHKIGDPGYSSINALMTMTPADNTGEFMPFLPLRLNWQNLADDSLKDTVAYKSSVRMFEKLGLDFVDIADKVNSNPDVDKVIQAILMSGIPTNTEDQLSIKYLYHFFQYLYTYTLRDAQRKEGDVVFNPHAKEGMSFVIKDEGFEMAISYSSIFGKKDIGNFGPVGKYYRAFETKPFNVQVWRWVQGRTGEESTRQLVTETIEVPVYVIRYQVNTTYYIEVGVEDLTVHYKVDGMLVESKADDERTIIPVKYTIAQQHFSFFDRQRLFHKSLHLVFNSKQIVKLKWYQTGWFRAFMIVLNVILIIVTIGTYAPAAVATMAALMAGTLTLTIVLALLQNLLIMIALNLAVKYAVAELGVEFGIALAVVTAAVGLSDMSTFSGLITPDTLLAVMDGANSGINKVTQEKMGQYNSELQEFQLMAETKMKELEELQKALDVKSIVDPFDIMDANRGIRFGEDPTEFLIRTKVVGMAAELSAHFTHNYVELALQLPDGVDFS